MDDCPPAGAELDAVRDAIVAKLPPGLRAETPAQRKMDLQKGMGAVQTLLAAVGLLGLAAAALIAQSRLGSVFEARVRELAAGPGVTLLCGRFEGVDQRVIDARGLEELSLGDFVLSGGEPAAIALIDACVRLLPGVVGEPASVVEESFSDDLLEYPHYTKPQEWQGRMVPDVLLSGHHENVRAWRQAESERATQVRRPDLWARYQARPRPAPKRKRTNT